jgi:hypothetical protein
MWTGLVCLRIGTGGELLWIQYWTFGFHKLLGNCRLSKQLGISRVVLSPMELVNLSLSFFSFFHHSFCPQHGRHISSCLVAKSTDFSPFRRKQSGNGSDILLSEEQLDTCIFYVGTRVTLQSVRNDTEVSVVGGRPATWVTIVSHLTDGLVGWTVLWRQISRYARNICLSTAWSQVTVLLLTKVLVLKSVICSLV